MSSNSHVRACSGRGHRRRPGGPVGRLLPGAARAVVRDPRGQRARRRLVAQALGLAAAVHAGQVRRPHRPAVPGAAVQFPDQGRDGRLPRSATRSTSTCRCAPASRSIACGATARATSSTPATAASRPITSSSRWPPTRRRACRSSRATLDPAIVQLHSSEYQNPGQLRPGDVLHRRRRQFRRGHRHRRGRGRTARGWRGAHPGHVPFRIESRSRGCCCRSSSASSSIAC